jgi:hypothetical protein
MDIRYQVVAIDAAELEPVSTFWAGVLEGTVDVDDLAGTHEEVMALGARLLQAAPDLDAQEGWQVYADPAGRKGSSSPGHCRRQRSVTSSGRPLRQCGTSTTRQRGLVLARAGRRW